MKGGFKLLKTRSIDSNLDLIEFEKSIGFKLPTLYRLFLKTFYVGENQIKQEFYRMGEDLYYCSAYYYKPKEYISFDHFLSLEMSQNLLSDYDPDSYEIRNRFFPIGATGRNATIFVGCSESEFDKIYFESGNNWEFISENIFEFVRGIEYWTKEEDFEMKDDIPFSKLVKNWNEDFWRIKK